MTFVIETNPISESSHRIYQINLGRNSIGDGKFQPGLAVRVQYVQCIDDQEEYISADGTLQANGQLAGQARIYKNLALQVNDRLILNCDVLKIDGQEDDQIATIVSIIRNEIETTISDLAGRQAGGVADELAGADGQASGVADELVSAGGQAGGAADGEVGAEGHVGGANEDVLRKYGAHHVHFDMYRPELFDHWKPTAEVDVYLAFGMLQEYTEYYYCCGVNKQVLRDLGIVDHYGTRENGVPDAIFIDRSTRRYLIAEFKVNSRDFHVNHKPEFIDVLVCWDDDEVNRKLLPRRVVALKDKARQAGAARFG